jgi:hypothetical protein
MTTSDLILQTRWAYEWLAIRAVVQAVQLSRRMAILSEIASLQASLEWYTDALLEAQQELARDIPAEYTTIHNIVEYRRQFKYRKASQ